MGEYTKGPWSVGMSNGHNPSTIFADGDDAIASVFGVPMHCHIDDIKDIRDAHPLANARLIAAAPDMLEALKITARTLEGESGPRLAEENFPALYAALSKAQTPPHSGKE